MPRPKLSEEEARSKVFAMRMTAKEWQAIESDAKRRGQSVADHIRRVMLMVANREVLVR